MLLNYIMIHMQKIYLYYEEYYYNGYSEGEYVQ